MTKYDVTGMTCAACSARVEKAVKGVEGVRSCAVNLLTNSLVVEGDVSSDVIIEAVIRAGYGASLKGEKKVEIEDKGSKVILKRLFISAFLLIVLMYFSMGPMLGIPLISFFNENHMANGIVQMTLNNSLLVVLQVCGI